MKFVVGLPEGMKEGTNSFTAALSFIRDIVESVLRGFEKKKKKIALIKHNESFTCIKSKQW